MCRNQRNCDDMEHTNPFSSHGIVHAIAIFLLAHLMLELFESQVCHLAFFRYFSVGAIAGLAVTCVWLIEMSSVYPGRHFQHTNPFSSDGIVHAIAIFLLAHLMLELFESHVSPACHIAFFHMLLFVCALLPLWFWRVARSASRTTCFIGTYTRSSVFLIEWWHRTRNCDSRACVIDDSHD